MASWVASLPIVLAPWRWGAPKPEPILSVHKDAVKLSLVFEHAIEEIVNANAEFVEEMHCDSDEALALAELRFSKFVENFPLCHDIDGRYRKMLLDGGIRMLRELFEDQLRVIHDQAMADAGDSPDLQARLEALRNDGPRKKSVSASLAN
jgi:hypothetical protein